MRKKRILVIDDDDHIRDFISVILIQLGHMVVTCDTFEHALIGFSSTNYSLIIADLFMGGMGGIKGIETLHKQKPDVPIIAISAGYAGMPSEIALRAAEKMGADMALAKPLSIEQLQEAVGHFLSEKKS